MIDLKKKQTLFLFYLFFYFSPMKGYLPVLVIITSLKTHPRWESKERKHKQFITLIFLSLLFFCDVCYDFFEILVGLPGIARDFYCQLCISVSPLYLYLYISPKPNLPVTLNMPACWPACQPARPPLFLSHPFPLSFQMRNSLLLRLILGWTNSFII